MEKNQAIIDVLLSQVKKEDSLPPLSKNSLLLQQEITKKSPGFKKIEKMIKSDPALTSHILRIANSVVYKGLEQIDTVKEAMLRLGTQEISNIASWAIHQSNFQTKDSFIKTFKSKLWVHSLSVAVGSSWTAKYLDLDADEVVSKSFISGLLHDMGSLCLLIALEKVKKEKKIADYPSDFVLNELIKKFHSDQGYQLLKYWNLPKEFYTIARDHHTEEFDQSDSLLILIRLVDKICHKMENGNKPEETAAIVSSVEANLLGLSEIGIAEIEIKIESAQKKFNRTG
ncbi:MAG: HDOD domain-containing protein [Desulfobacteraceae bacterium]|nr:HDOD domain-containing protein [Desulfobacteraceae bacterium]